MAVKHEINPLRHVVHIPSVWDQPYQSTHHFVQIERWCQANLQGTYRLGWYNTRCMELRMATPEDHALVQLTWQ
jgi:hypothetical protein